MEDLSYDIISTTEFIFEDDSLDGSNEKFIAKYYEIIPIISMINKKDYDSLNKYCDNIKINKDIKHKIFLTTCAITDDIKMIDYVLNRFDIDIHKTNNSGYNCALIACRENTNLKIIKYLIEEKNMNLESKDIHGNNCLLNACELNSNLEVIKYFIEEKNMSLEEINVYGENCLLCACGSNKNLDIIKYLVEEKQMSIHSKNNIGDNCLLCACRINENLEIIKYLIEEKKMDVDKCFNGYYTCFDIACCNNNLMVAIYLLITVGVNVTLKGVGYKTYVRIILLIQNNYRELNRLLLCGTKKYSTKSMTKIVKNINPLKLQSNILDLYEIESPYNKKYSDFIKVVDDLNESDNKFEKSIYEDSDEEPDEESDEDPDEEPDEEPDESGNDFEDENIDFSLSINLELFSQRAIERVKIAGITKYTSDKVTSPFDINYAKRDLLFKHNNICYYGDQNIINDSILCLKDISDTHSFDQPVELEGSLPQYVINLYIQSMYELSFNISKIDPMDIFDFIKFVDQYPTSSLSIDSLEGDIVKYFNERNIDYNDTMKEICNRYGLKLMYMDMHNKKLLKKQENK